MLRKLLSFLDRSKPQKARAPAAFSVKRPEELLASPHRKELLRQIKHMTSLPEQRWHSLYTTMISRYAALVQELPASEVHHHCGVGGMLDHTLEVTHHAMKMRQGYVLPAGGAPELSGPIAELYTYAVATAALLHDIGKIACDQVIEVLDAQGQAQRWHPWEGPMEGVRYRIKFCPERCYAIHEPTSLLLAQQIIPNTGLSWLASQPEVWANWVQALSGDKDGAGAIGEIIEKADSASVAKNLGARSNRPAAQTSVKPLHQKMLTALRYLLHENKLPLNRPGAAGWLSQNGLWLVSKVAADAIRAQLLADGQDGIPSQNSRLFDVLSEHQLIMLNEDKAIWHCRVDNGQGWQHDFTLLRLDPSRMWSEERRPANFDGTVTPLEMTAGGLAQDAQPSEQPIVPAADRPMPSVGPVDPQSHPLPKLSSDYPVITPQAAINNQDLTHVLDQLTSSLLPPPISATCSAMEPSDMTGLGITVEVPCESRAAVTDNQTATASPLPVSPPPTTPRELGMLFHQWVREGVSTKQLAINEANAMIHTVAGGVLLVTPGIFQAFAAQHEHLCAPFAAKEDPDAATDTDQLLQFARGLKKGTEAQRQGPRFRGVWKVVQRGFQQLKLHEKTLAGESVWACTVEGGRRKSVLKGFYIKEQTHITASPLPENPYLKLNL